MENLISQRPVNYEGIDTLWWVTTDRSAFNGPLRDWVNGKDSFLKYVKEKKLVIQAGGNCGMYARFYGNYFEEVYSFEPSNVNFLCLERNCQGKKYHLYPVAVGEQSGNGMLTMPKRRFKNTGVYQVIEKSDGDIPIISIDSLRLDRCDLIHFDIEGFEPHALRGARETIEKYKPVIILEAGHGAEVIISLGYRLVEKLDMDWIFIYE